MISNDSNKADCVTTGIFCDCYKTLFSYNWTDTRLVEFLNAQHRSGQKVVIFSTFPNEVWSKAQTIGLDEELAINIGNKNDYKGQLLSVLIDDDPPNFLSAITLLKPQTPELDAFIRQASNVSNGLLSSFQRGSEGQSSMKVCGVIKGIFCGTYGTLYMKKHGNIIKNNELIDFLNQQHSLGTKVLLLHTVPEAVKRDVASLGLNGGIVETLASFVSYAGKTLEVVISHERRSQVNADRWLISGTPELNAFISERTATAATGFDFSYR